MLSAAPPAAACWRPSPCGPAARGSTTRLAWRTIRTAHGRGQRRRGQPRTRSTRRIGTGSRTCGASCSMRTATATPEAGVLQRLPGGRRRRRPERPVRRGGGRRRAGQDRVRRCARIENMAARCVQGRAVMIDLDAHFGRSSGRAVGHDGAQAEAIDGGRRSRSSGVTWCACTPGSPRPAPGDERREPDRDLLVSTTSRAVLDGRDRRLLRAVDHGQRAWSALIADNYAVEAHAGAVSTAGRALRGAAAARALPLQARRAPRGDLAPHAARRVVACAGSISLPADCSAAAPARGGRLPDHAGGDGLKARRRTWRPRSGARRQPAQLLESPEEAPEHHLGVDAVAEAGLPHLDRADQGGGRCPGARPSRTAGRRSGATGRRTGPW